MDLTVQDLPHRRLKCPFDTDLYKYLCTLLLRIYRAGLVPVSQMHKSIPSYTASEAYDLIISEAARENPSEGPYSLRDFTREGDVVKVMKWFEDMGFLMQDGDSYKLVKLWR